MLLSFLSFLFFFARHRTAKHRASLRSFVAAAELNQWLCVCCCVYNRKPQPRGRGGCSEVTNNSLTSAVSHLFTKEGTGLMDAGSGISITTSANS
uniref:Putative secreted protein n=1 Tax=Anopheles darlingi TaxID=43151 RepID=A0A2M4D2A5_ANODA